MDSRLDDSGQGRSRRPEFLTTRFVIIIASLVVLGIVGTVIAVSANSAARMAQDAAEQVAEQAVSDFKNAATECKLANSALNTAVADAATTANIDPSSLADSTLIVTLRAISTRSSAAHACTAPTMAADTDAIDAQTAAMQSEINDVRTAAKSLVGAANAVTASVDEKKAVATNAAAAADQAAAAAAQASRTWRYTSDDGHTFTLVLSAGSPETDDSWLHNPKGSSSCGVTTTCDTLTLRDVCTDFDPSTMIAVPVTATFTATTQGFSTNIPIQLRTLVHGKYAGPNSNMGHYLTDNVEIGRVWSSGPSCTSPDSDQGGYQDDNKTGDSFVHKFVVILKNWKTPNAPAGDRALLDWVAISPYPLSLNGGNWRLDSTNVLTLSNNIVKG